MVDYLIVGAGLAGSTCARLLAEKGKSVWLLDRRDHIAGNAYDCYNEYGILIHRYGPHIFHTRHQDVWEFLSRFTGWNHYEHVIKAYVNGRLLPFPVNVNTVNELYGTDYTHENIKQDFFDRFHDGLEIRNARDMAVNKVGPELYELFFKNYTRKQWGIAAEDLEPEVTARIPVRFNRDDRYFDDPYQGLPMMGYTVMVQTMLDHPNISIHLNTDYKDILGQVEFQTMIFTGPVDYFFDYRYGHLGYRSLKFEWETLQTGHYQPVAQVNYPNDYEFTRITEIKYMTGQSSPWTTITREYPTSEGEPFYPIPTPDNRVLYNKYLQETLNLPKVHFTGRLGLYRYLNMDLVVKEAMDLVERLG